MKLYKIFFILIILISVTSCSSSDDDPQNDSQVVIDSGENSNNNSSQNSDHLITTPSGNKVSSLLMSSSEYSDWKSNDQFSEASYREAIVKDIYKEFSDKYDFIFLVLNEEEIPNTIIMEKMWEYLIILLELEEECIISLQIMVHQEN